jgi:nucleoid-associated protein YgaU
MATKYQIAAGDTFRSVAVRFYGDARMAATVAAANHMSESDSPLIGQEIVIPYITERHTVATDDTMFDVAEKYYGNGAMFPVLAAANHIGEPYLIRPGDMLLVPDLINISRHTVFPGDSVTEFANRWYNDEQASPVIAYANHLDESSDIRIGQELVRPGLNRRHTIEAGETWPQLAQWWYSDPSLDRLIAVANGLSVEESPPFGHILFLPDLADF